jgi:hypothetical protein
MSKQHVLQLGQILLTSRIMCNFLCSYPKFTNVYQIMMSKIMKLSQLESPQLDIYNSR